MRQSNSMLKLKREGKTVWIVIIDCGTRKCSSTKSVLKLECRKLCVSYHISVSPNLSRFRGIKEMVCIFFQKHKINSSITTHGREQNMTFNKT